MWYRLRSWCRGRSSRVATRVARLVPRGGDLPATSADSDASRIVPAAGTGNPSQAHLVTGPRPAILHQRDRAHRDDLRVPDEHCPRKGLRDEDRHRGGGHPAGRRRHLGQSERGGAHSARGIDGDLRGTRRAFQVKDVVISFPCASKALAVRVCVCPGRASRSAPGEASTRVTTAAAPPSGPPPPPRDGPSSCEQPDTREVMTSRGIHRQEQPPTERERRFIAPLPGCADAEERASAALVRL